MRTTKVEVAPIDITCGKRGSSSSCPIALALKRSFPGNPVHVGTLMITVDDDVAKLPNNAQDFVKNFDNGESVEPFTFYVNFPD